MVTSKTFGVTPEGKMVHEFTISAAHGISMKVINYGCTITSILVPDRSGIINDVVLGFDTLDGYLNASDYLGCLIGRCANRIAHGRYKSGRHQYQLTQNSFPHHLHGGRKGFDKMIWEATLFENETGYGVEFFYHSPDLEEGYPGSANVIARYLFNDEGAISMHYEASSDQETIINLTQHLYYNLRGTGNALNHELRINADRFLPADRDLIPTGEMRNVVNSPFDFREPKQIGLNIHEDDEQLKIGTGYDHNFILNKNSEEIIHAATLYDPMSGRRMELYTTEPAVQLYTANFLNEVMGKGGRLYGPYSAVCIEAQHYPDSPNHPEFPSINLKPGELYQTSTILKFSTGRSN
jgi:aldose 1-epimerase